MYDKKRRVWIVIMDHLVNNTQQKKARDEYKTHSLDVGISEARFQAISTT